MPAAKRLTRDEQRERTRTELLAAAASVFAAKGFHAASVDDVAVAAGFTKGAVYSNFTSKQDLFLALFEQSAQDTVSTLDEILEAPAQERVAALGARHDSMTQLTPQWHLLETEFTLYVARNPHLRPMLAERQIALRSQIAERVQRHLADLGLTTTHDGNDVARILSAATNGLTMQQVAEGEDAPDMGRLFVLLLEVVFAGIATAGD
jgi:AcrR family transcriptional regulator